MKIFLILVCVSMLNAQGDTEKEKRIQKQIEIEMKKEKKYAEERTFYKGSNYDFKGAEVNPDSIESLPDIENQDDFDMDSVYD